jgi:hypothetical protein
MADFALRNRFAIRFVALVPCLFLLFLLNGCAVTPKTAASRFDSFSQVTTDLGTQVINAYVLDDTIAKKARIMEFVSTYDPGRSVFLTPPTAVPNNVLHARQVLVLGLVTYATALKNIMDDAPLTTFSEKAAAVGKELDGIKSTLSPLGLAFPSGVSGAELGTAVAELGTFLMHLERRQFLKDKIGRMNENILKIITFLKKDLGTCECVKNAGVTYYCLKAEKGKLAGVTSRDVTEATGLGLLYCNDFIDYQMQYQRRLAAKPSAGAKPGAKATPAALTGDQLKLAEQQAQLNWNAKSACDALELLGAALDAYAAVHKELATAFDDQSSVLAGDLNKLAVKIAQIKKLFDGVIAN